MSSSDSESQCKARWVTPPVRSRDVSQRDRQRGHLTARPFHYGKEFIRRLNWHWISRTSFCGDQWLYFIAFTHYVEKRHLTFMAFHISDVNSLSVHTAGTCLTVCFVLTSMEDMKQSQKHLPVTNVTNEKKIVFIHSNGCSFEHICCVKSNTKHIVPINKIHTVKTTMIYLNLCLFLQVLHTFLSKFY